MNQASRNLFAHFGSVTNADREVLLEQKSVTVWLTGLSASGKSTLAYALEKALVTQGWACYVLDGDNVRKGLNKDLGFSDVDRAENIRRVAEVAALMNDAGLIVVSAFISPFASDRALAKEVIGADRFVEVYLDTPLAICEARDPKGLYKSAKEGKVAQFTGVSQPYEAPTCADIVLNSALSKVAEDVAKVLEYLKLDVS